MLFYFRKKLDRARFSSASYKLVTLSILSNLPHSLSVANSPANAAAAATLSAKLATSTSSYEARKISSSSTKTKSVFSSDSEKVAVAGRLADFDSAGIDMKR